MSYIHGPKTAPFFALVILKKLPSSFLHSKYLCQENKEDAKSASTKNDKISTTLGNIFSSNQKTQWKGAELYNWKYFRSHRQILEAKLDTAHLYKGRKIKKVPEEGHS